MIGSIKENNKGIIYISNILELLLLLISNISLINVFFLTIDNFNPTLSCFIGAFITMGLVVLFRRKIPKSRSKYHYLLLFILLLAIFLRVSPNLYLTGGQDQGSYVSLSKQYEVNHSLYIKDELREDLSNEIKNIYDKGNVFTGLKPYDKDNSEYIIPFYPVFPSWMSIFGNLFGLDNRIYALTMFSLLSIISVYLFSYEISNRNQKVALLSSFFLAINPLHVYFSKVPVTEVVSMTFLFFALYLVIKFFNDSKKGKYNIFYLILSIISFVALFYTRMSAIFLLPVIAIVPIISVLFSKNKKQSKYYLIYALTWVVLFLLSYLYYYLFLPQIFDLIVGKRVLAFISIETIAITLLSIPILTYFVLKIKKCKLFLKNILIFFQKNLYIFSILIFLGLIGYQMYGYVKEILIDNSNTILSFESLSFFKQLSFLTTFLYLSPFLFILLPVSFIHFRKSKDIRINLLIITIIIFLISSWGIATVTRYHYYFARYQLSELIPFCLILISILLVRILKIEKIKKLIVVLTVLTSLYFFFFSIIQLRDSEGLEGNQIKEVKEIVGEDGTLFVLREDFGSFSQIVFPMRYYYDINLFPMYSSKYFGNVNFQEYTAQVDKKYVLSSKKITDVEELVFLKEIDFKHNYFVHCLRDEDAYFEMESHSADIPFCEYMIIPNRYYYGTYKMYLYSWE